MVTATILSIVRDALHLTLAVADFFYHRQDFLERSYSQKLAAQHEREVAEAAAAARAQEAAKLQQQWEQQTYAKRASLAAACGARSSAAAPSHGGRGPYDSPPVMVRTEQPPMGARTRVRGWSGYSSADSLVSPISLCSLFSNSSTSGSCNCVYSRVVCAIQYLPLMLRIYIQLQESFNTLDGRA
jgi:hypothetical protein